MRLSCRSGSAGVLAGMSALLLLAVVAVGQDDVVKSPGLRVQKAAAQDGADENVQTIDDDYNKELVQLERRRLERLSRLAARQDPADAAATYEQLFRLAIARNQFRDAEPAAIAVLSKGSPSVVAT